MPSMYPMYQRDPSYWVDQDLLSFVRFSYPPNESPSLLEVIREAESLDGREEVGIEG